MRSRGCAEGQNLGLPVDDAMLVMVVGSASKGMEVASWAWKEGEKVLARAWAAPWEARTCFCSRGRKRSSRGWIERLVRFFCLNIYQLPLARVQQTFFRGLLLFVGEICSEENERLILCLHTCERASVVLQKSVPKGIICL